MARVLVTGANGFIGANIVRAALEKGYEVTAFVRKTSDISTIKDLPIEFAYGDLRDTKSVRKAMEPCDYVIHNGAIYLWMPMWFWANQDDIETIYEVNVWATDRLFKVAKEIGIKKVIFTSSESAVGIDSDEVADESKFARDFELSGHYKRSKYLGELAAFKWNKRLLPTCTVLPTVPIGPYDIKPTPTGRILRDFMNGKMPGFVDTKLNIVHVYDVAMAHVLAIKNGKPGARYIAGNKNMAFQDFLRLAADVTGRKAPEMKFPVILAQTFALFDEFISVYFKHTHPETPMESVAAAKYRQFDCSKAWNELGMPKTNLRKAIKEEVDWFRENGYIKS